MINIGMIGMGGISGAHLPAYAASGKARLVARCDKIAGRADGTAAGITINIGAGATEKSDATPYLDYRDLLADPKVDVVDICLPTDLHAEVAIAALEAGKDVLCEKPMAYTVAQCDRMIAAANASGGIFMIAQCIRFWPEYVFLKELVDSGKFGKVLTAQFTRLSMPPTWASEGWMQDPARCGGAMLDMHIHDADYVMFLLGKPAKVSTFATENKHGIGFASTEYIYADGQSIHAEGGWDYPGTFPFRMTFRARLEGGAVEWDAARGALTVYPEDGEAFTPEMLAGTGYDREIAYFLECVQSRKQPTIVTPEDARESVRLIYAEIDSFRSGKPVAF